MLLFPVLPPVAILLSLACHYLCGRDSSRTLTALCLWGQLLCGGLLLLEFHDAVEPRVEALSYLDHSIVFIMSRPRVFFLAALLTPMALALPHLHLLADFNIRLVFLFYLTGCSGIVVTGDLFNFFVFYEVMIMAGYILITLRGRYYAGIMYMLFGAVSSLLLLGGIIAWYASGGSFSLLELQQARDLPRANVAMMMTLFGSAFLIKSGFFPVSAWPATCHAATNGLVSSFLSSFTIFSGIFGFYHMVLLPAESLGAEAVFLFLRAVSILTLLTASVILYFEPELKRCIAGSTVISIGLVGGLLSYRLYEPALVYMMVHAVFKSALFLLYERIEEREERYYLSAGALVTGAVAILFAIGIFPTLGYFAKQQLFGYFGAYRLGMVTLVFLMAGAFLKFRFRLERRPLNLPLYSLLTVLMLTHYLVFPFYRKPGGWGGVLLDAGIIGLAIVLGPSLYRRCRALHAVDRRILLPQLNAELLMMVVILVAQTVYYRLMLTLPGHPL